MSWNTSLLILILALAILVLPRNTYAQDINSLKAGVVRIENSRLKEVGTGFIVKIDGRNVYVITAAHVVRGEQNPKIRLFSEQFESLSASILDREDDNVKGLALLLLKIDGPLLLKLIPLSMGNTSDLGNGESVKIIGFPGGTSLWTVDNGYVKRLEGRNLVLSGVIREGNSGGPVVLNGQAIGLITDVNQSDVYATRAEFIVPYVNGIVKNLIVMSDPRSAAVPAALAGTTWEATVYHEDCKDATDQERCRKPRKFLYTFHPGGRFSDTEVDIYECAPNCEDEGYWEKSGDSITVNLRGVMSDGADEGDITIEASLRGGQLEGQGRFKSEYLPARWRFTAVRSKPREVAVVLDLVGTKWVGKLDDCINSALIKSERPLFVSADWHGQDNSALYPDLCRFELSFIRGGRFVHRDLAAKTTTSGTWRQEGGTLTASYTDKDGDTFTFKGTNNGIKITGSMTLKYRANSDSSASARRAYTAKWTAIR